MADDPNDRSTARADGRSGRNGRNGRNRRTPRPTRPSTGLAIEPTTELTSELTTDPAADSALTRTSERKTQWRDKRPDTRPDKRQRPQPSLLARALSSLARREHSRCELRRKLAPHAENVEDVDRLLDDLQAKKLLSDERFVEVLKRSRGERFGAARIKQELKSHQVGDDLVRAAVDELRQTELARAHAVWQRRFGEPAADAAERAKQMRFLAQRGFNTEVIIKVVRGATED